METPQSSSRETLTLEELAAALDISLTTAYQLARTNTLPIPALKLGRQWRFSRRVLDRYLDSGTAYGETEVLYDDAA